MFLFLSFVLQMFDIENFLPTAEPPDFNLEAYTTSVHIVVLGLNAFINPIHATEVFILKVSAYTLDNLLDFEVDA